MNQIRISQRKERIELGVGPIVSIMEHPSEINCIIVASSSGSIFYLKMEPFKIVQEFKLFYQYCLCAIVFQGGICAGGSNGELARMNILGEVEWRKKVHSDCISGIVETLDHLVTVSHDCHIKFLNKLTQGVEKEIDLESPIWSAAYLQNTIFTSGNRSYSIPLSNFTPRKIKRFDHFGVFNNKLYACSDERGLTCLTTNSNSYIPCNFILPLGDRMMIFSEECIGEITHETNMQWKCHRIKEIKPGTTITSGCSNKSSMILGDVEGFVYKIDLENESS